jgi:type VI secretion system lysozyme-like protein
MIALFDKLVLQNDEKLSYEIHDVIMMTMNEFMKKLIDLYSGKQVIQSVVFKTHNESELYQCLPVGILKQIGIIVNRSAETLSNRCTLIIRNRLSDYSIPLMESIDNEVDATFIENRASAAIIIDTRYKYLETQSVTIDKFFNYEKDTILSILLKMKKTILDDIFSEISKKKFSKNILDILQNDRNYKKRVEKSIVNEVNRILTSRTHVAGINEQTILTFGFNGPAGLSHIADRDAMCNAVKNAITTFEPRLHNVKVDICPSSGSEEAASISISGTMTFEEKEERIHFAIKDGAYATGI